MITSRMEATAVSVARPTPSRAGLADGETSAFEAVIREQDASTDVTRDARGDEETSEVAAAAGMQPLDLLIAQALPQQQVEPSIGETGSNSETMLRLIGVAHAVPYASLDRDLDAAALSNADAALDSRSLDPPETIADAGPAVVKIPEGAAQATASLIAFSLLGRPAESQDVPIRARRIESARATSLDASPSPLRFTAPADIDPVTAPRAQEAAPGEAPGLPGPLGQRTGVDVTATAPEKNPFISPETKDAARRDGSVATDAAPSAEIRRVAVRHVASSTHFPVVADPVRQIAGEVTRALETPAAYSPSEPLAPAVKTISVQLEPESLGAVTLRMRLSGGHLQIRVDVAEPATLDLIQRERDRLQKSMTTENVTIERLEIRAASEPTPIPSSEGANAPKQDMNAPGQQSRQNGPAQGGEQRRENRGEPHSGSAQSNWREDDSSGVRDSRGVYL